MKKFAVLRIYKHMSPDIMLTTDNEQDAIEYARIMVASGDNYNYAVYKLVEE